MRRVAVVVAPLVALFGLLFASVVVLGSSSASPAAAAGCVPSLPASGGGWHLSVEQWRNAATVIGVGRRSGVPPRGWVVGLAAAMRESTLRALPYGDRDSIGLFQQRTAWGSYADRIDPVSASTMFFTGGHGGQPGLLDVAGWEAMSVAEAAQAVQRSAYPDAYARWEQMAVGIVRKLAGVSGSSCAGAGRWVSPVTPGSFVFRAFFGECGPLWEHCHTGLDFAAPTGTPAMAASAGVVVFSGWGGPYGNLVKVLHPGAVATWYAHLDRRLVTAGQRVAAGDVVGLIGQTGNTTGPHLHLEVRLHATRTVNGTAVDPLGWLRTHHTLP